MISASAVTIVVNGSIVPSVSPARIVAGRVVAPLTPIVMRLAARIAYKPATATIAVERAGRRIVVRVVFVENDVPFVEIGPVVRGMGGSAAFDSPTKTLAIVLTPAEPIATPVPFDPGSPVVEPTTVFTPAPPPATPPSTETGVPQPRRTAIPVTPSRPVVPPPAADPTKSAAQRSNTAVSCRWLAVKCRFTQVRAAQRLQTGDDPG